LCLQGLGGHVRRQGHEYLIVFQGRIYTASSVSPNFQV
jgi:hypothetical protein